MADKMTITEDETGSGPLHIDEPSILLSWYCVRTKPKSEHIAAGNLRRNSRLEVFHPRLRVQQTTIRGIIKNLTEPVFPGYLFVQCNMELHMDALRHTSGVSSIVNFGGLIPPVPEDVVADLQACFGGEELLDLPNEPRPGDPVTVAAGAFMGMNAVVLRSWPAKQRVQVLLEILGRPTPIEIEKKLLTLHRNSIAECLPILAAL